MKMKFLLVRKMQLAFGTVRRAFTSTEVRSIRLGAIGKIVFCSFLLAGLCDQNLASTQQNDQKSDEPLKQLSLEQLGKIEVTTASKLEFDQTYRYVSALPAQTVASYGTVDARLGWHVTPQLELSVVGHNLLQPHHAEFGGDPGGHVGIKRSGYAKITWQQWKR
jgi:hypothetical protein